MDFLAKVFCGLIAAWAVVMVIGLIIAIAPLLLYCVGFLLMLALLAFIGRLVASWFYY